MRDTGRISAPTVLQINVPTLGNSPDRLDEAKALAESLGGEFTDWYLTFGEHDAVAIAEFPDDETYAQFVLAVASTGNVSTEALKAFIEDECRDDADGVPVVG